jgi:uncharacterized protein (UPF0332 family)
MKEIADLIAKADKFLKTAEAALASGDYDSCVSRCYYAMFFMAQASLLTRGLRASSHKGVIRLFGEHFVTTGIFPRELGRMLSEAYDRRLRGDYAIGFDIEEAEAQRMMEQAREFVDEVRKYVEETGALQT